MYKKITHNIIEEHFDHPMVVPSSIISKSVGNNSSSSSTVTAILPEMMTEETMLFRMDSRTLWSKYIWGLMNYAISLNNNLPGTEQVKARIDTNADELGAYIAPYYGSDAGNNFASLLKTFSHIGIDVITMLKDGATLDGTESLWATSADNIAMFLNDLNPDNWDLPTIQQYLQALIRLWVDSIKARALEDWTANDEAINKIDQLITSGLPEISPSVVGGFADIFSRGIIADNPDKF